MSQPKVFGLTTYPIKSTQGINLELAKVTKTGLELDRHFVVTDLNGKFITGRTKSKLVLVHTVKTQNGLMLSAPGMEDFEVDYAMLSNQYSAVTVWNDKINSQHTHYNLDAWFSKYLASNCKVYFLGEKSQRLVKNSKYPLSFADGYPFLLISTTSLAFLNDRLALPVTMAQFRPNIVVDNCQAFAEDEWRLIKIGEVKFEIVKPCSRCIFTTVNAKTGRRDVLKEPLKTLNTFRQGDDKEIYFGQNMIALNRGTIKIGDRVEILTTQSPQTFESN